MHRHFDEEINGVTDRKCAVFQHVPDTYPHPFLVSLRHTQISFYIGSGVWITREKCSFNWIPIFYFLHSAQTQKDFFWVMDLMAFGCSIDNPSISHRNSCLVSGCTSEASFGHWKRPLSSRFRYKTNPSLSKCKALIVFFFRPQNRKRAFA